ncbi:MAG: pyridoxamine 5-phosphate oxidase family protein [Kribbellaceae bacterium]|jgi:pyridoxamine 5'-phosphate oxidase family protein|nr:pyridoxamine 5-phosphate oxidase family protein [Kribbellaceae bacterium]
MNTARMSIFNDSELAFLAHQKLGRLATKAPDGTLQNNPVGYFIKDGYVDIGGHVMGNSRKFHNVQKEPQVSLVIDDLSTEKGWFVRGIEIRGRAEALDDMDPPAPGYSREIIRIHPERILSWGLDESSRRNVS